METISLEVLTSASSIMSSMRSCKIDEEVVTQSAKRRICITLMSHDIVNNELESYVKAMMTVVERYVNGELKDAPIEHVQCCYAVLRFLLNDISYLNTQSREILNDSDKTNDKLIKLIIKLGISIAKQTLDRFLSLDGTASQNH